MLKKNYLLGVGITNETEDKILEYLLLSLEKSVKYYIVTPNPEILVHANKNPAFKKILNGAEIALPDGVGVFIASGLAGNPFKERIAGVDFMEEVCRRSSKSTISIGFLGGRKGIAQRTADCLKSKYPGLNAVFVGDEWSSDMFIRGPAARFSRPTFSSAMRTAGARREALTRVTPSPYIDILFVAFGHPKQEEWIYNNLSKLPVKVAMGVGGAFDYISGEVNRAPFMIRAIGFEWLYRLLKEPWRWNRQLALAEFIRLVLKEGLQSLTPKKPL